MTLPSSTEKVAARFNLAQVPRSALPALLTAAALTLGAVLPGCGSRENNTLGVDLIEDQSGTKAVRTVTLAPPDTSEDFQLAASEGTFGQSPQILLGRLDGLFARGLLRFDLGPFPDSGQGATLQSATMRLFYDEGAGDPATLVVRLHRVLSSWAETIGAADSLFPSYEASAVDVPLTVASGGDSADVDVTELARFWIDRPDSNFGVAIVANAGVTALLEFASSEGLRSPQLLGTWTISGGDSSAVSTPTDDTYFVMTEPGFVPLSDEPRRLAVGRGIAARSLLKFGIPDFGPRASIHRAELTVFPDLARSRVTDLAFGAQRVLAEPWNAGSTGVNASIDGTVTADAATDSLTLVVTSTVSAMVESGNFGFLLRATAEATDVEYIRLHAHDSEDEARRPRLRIWYTAGDQPGDAP